MKQRFIPLIGIPLFTLLLGIQIGQRIEQEVKRDDLLTPQVITTGSGQIITNPQRQVDIGLLWSVWNTLLDRYVDSSKLNANEMVTGAVQGMVAAIGDPYTLYMSAKENKDFRQALSGQLQGIGAELAQRSGVTMIVSPIKGSPAQSAGLMPDDVIVSVDGTSLDGKTLNEVVTLVRGPKGTKVTLTINRPSERKTFDVAIVRDDIKVPSTEQEIKKTAKGDIGYLSLNQFGDATVADATAAIRELMKNDLKGFSLDLRFNGGGYLEGADDLTSLFLKEGEIVSIERKGADVQHHGVSGRALLPTLPLVVLVNQGTASASEIVAGAIQDHKRGTLIGMKTFGKGSVQEVIDFPGGGSLRVTIAKWFTPNKQNIDGKGLMPDIIVDRTEADFESDKDPQLEAALEFLTSGKVVKVKTGTGAAR